MKSQSFVAVILTVMITAQAQSSNNTVSVCSTVNVNPQGLQPQQPCYTSYLFVEVMAISQKCTGPTACQCLSGNNNSWVNDKCTVEYTCSAAHLACKRAAHSCYISQLQRLKGDAQCGAMADSQLSIRSCTQAMCQVAGPGATWNNAWTTWCSNPEISVACALSGAAVVRISGAVFALAMVVLMLLA